MANKSQTTANKSQSSGSKKSGSTPAEGSASVEMRNGTARSSNGKQTRASNLHTLDQLLEKGLQDAYSAETQLLKALPEMAKAADSEELQAAFENHLRETQKHVERLEKVCSRLGVEPEGESCAAMEGLIEEGRKVISEYEESAVRDSALIIAAQKVEHYELATYGSLCELADVLGHHKVSDILGRTFSEEQRTDILLSDIARDVNDEACEMSGGASEEEDY